MYLRFTPRFLVLFVLGLGLTLLGWRALDPLARLGVGMLEADEARRCHWEQRTIAGAVEMYQLDYNLSGSTLDAQLFATLLEQGYLRRLPEHPRPPWDRGPVYRYSPESPSGIYCRIHGEGGYRLHRPLAGLAAFTQRVALPYTAGVLVTLLLQSLLAWRRRRHAPAATEEATLPAWFTDPVFRPVTKPVVAGLGPDACCPVCAQHLVGGVESMVECLHCATPHHLDCAGYTARCGVYGCAEPDQAPGTPA